jgi:hypothetical protein
MQYYEHSEISVELWFSSIGARLVATGLKPAYGTHMCRGLAPCDHTMQGKLTNRIGVFRHRSAALFKYENRIRGIRKLPDISKTSELETGARSSCEASRERNTRFSVPSKEGRVVRQPEINIFKYLHTRFSVTSKEGRVFNKSAIHKFKYLISVNGAVYINHISK